MNKTSIFAFSLGIVMVGIGIFFLVPNAHADTASTQGKHDITFSITIDESLQEKDEGVNGGRHPVTVPDEQVNRVGKNGALLIEGLSGEDHAVFLNEEQMERLIDRDATIRIQKEDVMLEIPVANFSGKHDLTLMINRLDKNPHRLPHSNIAVGTIYDVTLIWGDWIQSLFEYGITLSFPVQDHDHPEELQVYYWNEEIEEWELVGGEYEEGYIHVTTGHFSIFALFHPLELVEQTDKDSIEAEKEGSHGETSTGDQEGSKGGPKGEEKKQLKHRTTDEEDKYSINGIQSDEQITKHEGGTLPSTATNTYHFIVIGIVLFLLGGLVYFWHHRLENKNVT